MIVAILSALRFKQDDYKHTVFYAENCDKLAFENAQLGKFKAVIASDEAEAIKTIRCQLREYLLETSWLSPNAEDFRFCFNYSEIKDSAFWLMPSISNCVEYNI